MVSSNGTIREEDREGLLDVKGAAEFLKVGRNRVYGFVNEGILPCIQTWDNKKRFLKSSLLTFAMQHEKKIRRSNATKKTTGREKTKTR